MNFVVKATELKRAVEICSRAAAAKNPVEALCSILVVAEGGKVTLRSFDGKCGIRVVLQEVAIKQEGKALLDAKRFLECVKQLPTGDVTMSADRFSAKFLWGKSHLDFSVYDPESAPDWPDMAEKICAFDLAPATLGDIVEKTRLFMAADNGMRPQYTGVLFEKKADINILNAVALDGYRVAHLTTALEMDGSFSTIVPGLTMSHLQRICSEDAGILPVTVSLFKRHVMFDMGDYTLISLVLTGDFLNYEKSIPSNLENEIKAPTANFAAAIERSLISSDGSGSAAPVIISIGDGEARLDMSTARGTVEDYIPVDGNGNGYRAAFNPKYIRDCLKSAGTKQVVLKFGNAGTSPLIITGDEESDLKFRCMLLPVRIRDGK